MKNAPLIITLFIAFSIFSETMAQGFIRAGGGYAIGTNKETFGINSIEFDQSFANSAIMTESVIFGSFGEGGHFSIAGGYMINPYFGVELELYYFAGLKQNYGEDIIYNADGSIGYYQYQRTGYSYQMRALPSLIVQAPASEKFQPFARFGVLVPFWGRTVVEEKEYQSSNNQFAKTTLEVQGKLSIGFQSSIGLQYNITDNLGVYIQATYTGLRIRSDKATLVEDSNYDMAGNFVSDNLPGLPTIAKEIVFQDVMDENSNIVLGFGADLPPDVNVQISNVSSVSFDKPLNLPTQTSNFNSISFNVGMTYTFKKKDQ